MKIKFNPLSHKYAIMNGSLVQIVQFWFNVANIKYLFNAFPSKFILLKILFPSPFTFIINVSKVIMIIMSNEFFVVEKKLLATELHIFIFSRTWKNIWCRTWPLQSNAKNHPILHKNLLLVFCFSFFQLFHFSFYKFLYVFQPLVF